jgi:hypothetical protein
VSLKYQYKVLVKEFVSLTTKKWLHVNVVSAIDDSNHTLTGCAVLISRWGGLSRGSGGEEGVLHSQGRLFEGLCCSTFLRHSRHKVLEMEKTCGSVDH